MLCTISCCKQLYNIATTSARQQLPEKQTNEKKQPESMVFVQ